jgi:hypothetical protein
MLSFERRLLGAQSFELEFRGRRLIGWVFLWDGLWLGEIDVVE